MKWLKLGGVVILVIVAVVLIVRIGSCVSDLSLPFFKGRAGAGEGSSTVTPDDSSFSPVERNVYRPPSLPFSLKTSGVKLPKGVKEKQVARVTRLKWKGFEQPTDVIELKTGEILVEKDSTLESVSVLEFAPPALQIGMYPGIGISFPSGDRRIVVGPAACLSLAEWYGIVRAPTLVVDLDGAGLGAQVKLYHEIYGGALILWRYEETKEKMLKLTLQYNF